MCVGSAGLWLDLSRGRGSRRTSTALGGEEGGAERGGFAPVHPAAETTGAKPSVTDAFTPLVSPVPRKGAKPSPRRLPHPLPSRRSIRGREAPGQPARWRHRERHRAIAHVHGDRAPVDRTEPVPHPLAELHGELPRVARRVP